MSLHWSGVIQTKSATLLWARSEAKLEYGFTLAKRRGLFRISVKSTNGLCLLAYRPLLAVSPRKPADGIASM